MSLSQLCSQIEWIVSDVDGVLTDGSVLISDSGDTITRFNIRDGLGIRVWQEQGKSFGIITGRNVNAVRIRAEHLGIGFLAQGVSDKRPEFERLLQQNQLSPASVCYVGDDLPDLPLIQRAGLGVAVADAADEVRQAASYVTSVPGGSGAIREVVELILKNTNQWDPLVATFSS